MSDEGRRWAPGLGTAIRSGYCWELGTIGSNSGDLHSSCWGPSPAFWNNLARPTFVPKPSCLVTSALVLVFHELKWKRREMDSRLCPGASSLPSVLAASLDPAHKGPHMSTLALEVISC